MSIAVLLLIEWLEKLIGYDIIQSMDRSKKPIRLAPIRVVKEHYTNLCVKFPALHVYARVFREFPFFCFFLIILFACRSNWTDYSENSKISRIPECNTEAPPPSTQFINNAANTSSARITTDVRLTFFPPSSHPHFTSLPSKCDQLFVCVGHRNP